MRQASLLFVVLAGVAALSALHAADAATVQCMNEDEQPVDWWFVYKMPNGFMYAYHDSDSRTKSIAPYDSLFLNRTDGALGGTLHQVYANKQKFGYVLYNDEPVDSWMGKGVLSSLVPNITRLTANGTVHESKSGAHAKGVLATDGTTGFWLIHSVPKFPDLGPPSFTWSADDTYAQSFLCVSLDADNLRTASLQLQYMHPTIFSSNIPSAIADKVPELSDLIDGVRLEGSNVAKMTSLANHRFTSFAKDHDWGQDLYEDLVSPNLKLDFKWETWRRQSPLPSYCKGSDFDYDAINVVNMQVGDLEFSYTHDHSKMGVSLEESTVCVGDINRMETQRKRGGGTMCLSNAYLWAALDAAMVDTDAC